MIKRELDVEGIGMTSQRTRNRLVKRLRAKGINHSEILFLISRTPRHLFVEEALATRAYEDTALPIAYGQTISQPYIVARMTELLLSGDKSLDKVLEVGTGSGYQAAILAPLVGQLFTVERIAALSRASKRLLHELGYRNIHASISDGSWGLVQEAPFDAIIVTAAPKDVPKALLEQLAVGGRLIIPIGAQGKTQVLQQIIRIAEQQYETQNFDSVQFVPLLQGCD